MARYVELRAVARVNLAKLLGEEKDDCRGGERSPAAAEQEQKDHGRCKAEG
nr:MAG TPA: hypothetical protein [Caudoviricetes sp.]